MSTAEAIAEPTYPPRPWLPDPHTIPTDATAVVLSEGIHDRGRGPEVIGTRVTVFAILDYEGLSDEQVAEWIPILSVEQVRQARAFIADHRTDLMPEYERMVRRGREMTSGKPLDREAARRRIAANVARLKTRPEASR